jgi:adenosylhomocysteinase
VFVQFKVANPAAADYGRCAIHRAQSEMPGLLACREHWGAEQPLAGARVAGCIHLTEQTSVLVETLAALGADVRRVAS